MKSTKLIILTILVIFLFGFSSIKAAENLKIRINGITPDAQKNALERLNVVLEPYGKHLSTKEVEDFFAQATANIREAIKPFGYFKASIKPVLIKQNASTWLAVFDIDPGPLLKITNIKVQLFGPGATNPSFNKFINHFPLKTGDVLQIDKYEKTKEDLLQKAYNLGYINAVLEKKEIHIDLKKYSAEIIWALKTGERYFFGNIEFLHSTFAPSFLKRFITIPRGQPFSSEKLLKLQEDLGGSQYFRQVEITPKFDQSKNNEVPVKIKVTEPKSQKYNVGLGYGTFTGPRLTLGLDLRRITDTGQHFNAQVKISSVLSGLAAKYFIPGRNPLTDEYSIGSDFQKFAPKNGHSLSRSLSISSIKKINKWQTTINLNFLNESFKVKDEPSHVSQVIYPSFMVSHTKADNLLYPRFGNKVSLKIQAADKLFFSKNSFFQTEIKGKQIFSPTKESRVILRGDLGYSVVEDLNTLPLTLRFFAGGLGSVRGFAYSSLGPGRYLKVASAEFQHRVYGNWNGAIFYDVGTASNKFNASLSRGAGIGVIYISAIGPIQVYVSRAESTPGKPFRIDFNIGSDF